MRDSIANNWKDAISEVLASIVGTVGIVFSISIILSLQNNVHSAPAVFVDYFQGGQLGLSILASSGIIFIALMRHDRLDGLLSILLYIMLFLPIVATSFIIGINPGFKEDILGGGNIKFLWFIFCWLHILWFLILIFEPEIPNAQEAGESEERRVKKIKAGAAERG